MRKLKIQKLRKEYPKFIYEKYSWKISDQNLNIFFDFKIEPNIYFSPQITIKNIDEKRLKKIGDRTVDNLVFHLGMIELISYWKTTCSPEIIIKTGSLNKEQTKWWEDLILNGMGEFFYKNKIDFRKSGFLKIISNKNNKTGMTVVSSLKNRILVPVSGGKDSTATLELLKKAEKDINFFFLNPTKVSEKIIKAGDYKSSIIIKRKIDKKLLELNQKGYLNGHTPFSAYLAFLSSFCAIIFNYKYIAFSNERSSNEGNLKYLGKEINHQYSKTFDFEKKFRKYSKKYLSKDIEYFSFLRPLYEIQIAKIFSDFPKYFPLFISCNEAFKTHSGTKKITKKWCCNCPKCLFVWIILYPFIGSEKMIKIFGENLFENKKLLPLMKELIGEKGYKPFECVGEKKESLIAFYLSLKNVKEQTSDNLPFLLRYFQKNILPKYPNLEKESEKMLNSWNKKHFLPKNLEKILKES